MVFKLKVASQSSKRYMSLWWSCGRAQLGPQANGRQTAIKTCPPLSQPPMSKPPRVGPRAFSGAWGRLKPVTLDPLESMGLPSKGDNRFIHVKLAGARALC